MQLIKEDGRYFGRVNYRLKTLMSHMHGKQMTIPELKSEFPDILLRNTLQLLRSTGLVEVVERRFCGYSLKGKPKVHNVWQLTAYGTVVTTQHKI
jgi:hypothetical protein